MNRSCRFLTERLFPRSGMEAGSKPLIVSIILSEMASLTGVSLFNKVKPSAQRGYWARGEVLNQISSNFKEAAKEI
jgi:hypothetical protein